MFVNMACNVYVQGSVIIHPGMHMYSCMTVTSLAVISINSHITTYLIMYTVVNKNNTIGSQTTRSAEVAYSILV